MTIKLTPAEVKNFVAIGLGLNGLNFDLEIVPVESPVLVALRNALNENPRSHSDQKISAIKRFRGLCVTLGGPPPNLCDCKWAVENFVEAIRNLETTGKLRA